ncbi:hypothetical protein I8920_06035 [Curtobacterium sp. YC1]|nr:hypothetical protein [Curtobacterium sp. YC1]QQD77288.1 hypothetical protein I8920_06035 [Curtobacterium sp. YC1]
MRIVEVIGRGIGSVLRTIGAVIGTLNGAKPAGDDLAARLLRPRRDDHRP